MEVKRRVAEEMKLTWNKNKNNKKRSLEAIANYSNLPFDQLKPSADDTQLQNQKPAASQNQEKPSADALDSDSKQLAQSFQAQGNQLAEVYTFSLFSFSFFSCFQ